MQTESQLPTLNAQPSTPFHLLRRAAVTMATAPVPADDTVPVQDATPDLPGEAIPQLFPLLRTQDDLPEMDALAEARLLAGMSRMAADSIKARLAAIGRELPGWFSAEAALVIESVFRAELEKAGV